MSAIASFLINQKVTMNDRKIPEGINGWNWGAFLLTPFWALANHVYLGLVCWLPYLLFSINLIMLVSNHHKIVVAHLILWQIIFTPILFVIYCGVAILLGTYGSVYSWQKSNWTDVKAFKIVQRRWAIAGILLGISYASFNFYIWYLWQRFVDWAYYIINE